MAVVRPYLSLVTFAEMLLAPVGESAHSFDQKSGAAESDYADEFSFWADVAFG